LYLDWFLAGMTLALISPAIAHRPSRPRVVAAVEQHPNLCWLLAFGVYCSVAFRLINHPPTFRDHVLLGAFGMLVVLPGVFTGSGEGLVRAALRNRVLAWLGLISYGLYLWHGPMLVKLSEVSWVRSLPGGKLVALTLTSCAVTVVCATLSYYLVERPLLRYKRARPAEDGALRAPAYAEET
jgi:peptidoglycan/LPS O-acetylase OafA/YrhL